MFSQCSEARCGLIDRISINSRFIPEFVNRELKGFLFKRKNVKGGQGMGDPERLENLIFIQRVEAS